MKRFGSSYSGFYYPEDLRGLSAKSVIYCFGAGEDIEHDVAIAEKTGAIIHIFDPTPRAIAHVEKVKSSDLLLSNQLQMHPWGLYTKDIPSMKFYLPTNKEHVSCSLLEGMMGTECIEVPVKTLQTTMQELGHSKIDLLKLDIEGVECDVLQQMLSNRIKPKYLSVDFDLGWTGERLRDRTKVRQTVGNLLQSGYRILHRDEPNISFMYS